MFIRPHKIFGEKRDHFIALGGLLQGRDRVWRYLQIFYALILRRSPKRHSPKAPHHFFNNRSLLQLAKPTLRNGFPPMVASESAAGIGVLTAINYGNHGVLHRLKKQKPPEASA